MEGDTAVHILDEDSFENVLMKDEVAWIVEFYAPWCGHCKKMAPDWEEMANEIEGKVKTGKIDAEEFRDVGKAHGVKGFPHIIFYPVGPKSNETSIVFEGTRNKESMI